MAAAGLGVWELATGGLLARFPETRLVRQAAFAPDGRTIALLDGRGVRLHDLSTGQQLIFYPAVDVTCEIMRPGWVQTLVFAPDSRTLATGHRDGAVVLWKVPQLDEGVARPITSAEHDRLWADLGSASPIKSRSAVRRLADDPATAAALLTSRFQPSATTVDAAIVASIKSLDSGIFTTREDATRKLRDYGTRAEPALRHHLAGNPSLEMRRRIEALLSTIAPPSLLLPANGERLQGIRAIEVLERAGSPECRKLLQAWARQTADVHLATEARAALDRAVR
jgi:hypothetical protein